MAFFRRPADGAGFSLRPFRRRHLSGFLLAVPLACLAASALFAQAQPELVLADHGRSAFTICSPPNAPKSVTLAAEELRDYFRKAAGVQLEIVSKFDGDHLIALGVHDDLRRFGLSTDGIPLEGFRIATAGGHLFIFGPDTADGAQTPAGGFSRGTLNGAYTFIERHLGVRWLLPGDDGEYVPRLDTVKVGPLSITEGPDFLNRRVPYIRSDRPEVQRWQLRHKLGFSMDLSHSHNWQYVFPPKYYDDHPEYFALVGGRRTKPLNDRYKLCTTNPDVIDLYARAAVDYFRKNPARPAFSLSPTDSAGWCECDRCRALDETGPDGKPRITRRILTFYNHVADRVAPEFPDRKLCGYVYADYQFPPLDPACKVRANVLLVWAPSFNYGMTHFRPDVQALWHKTLAEWSTFAPHFSYYDLANILTQSSGAPNPPCREILKSMMPDLKRRHALGVYVYGGPAWGHHAALNYMWAKLAWNADADIDALCNEFYDRAYAAGGPAVRAMFDLLETDLARYYNERPQASYTLTSDMLKSVYGVNFARIEAFYRDAAAKVAAGPERKRLDMLADNLRVLWQALAKQGGRGAPADSIFRMEDQDFRRFLKDRAASFAIQPPEDMDTARELRVALTDAPTAAIAARKPSVAEPVTPHQLRGLQHLICRTDQDRDVTFELAANPARPASFEYGVYTSTGKKVLDGSVVDRGSFRFFAAVGEDYHLILKTSAFFSLKVSGAHWAVDSRIERGFNARGLHFLAQVTPVYFDVPAGIDRFSLTLSSDTPGETALATLYDPRGREAARFRTVEAPYDDQKIACGKDGAGVWKLVIAKAEKGIIDDVFVAFGPELSGYACLDPQALLTVTRGDRK